MAKAKLGTKRACPSCGARFYDLNKNPAECPECQTVFNPDELLRGRRSKSGPAAAEDTAKSPKKAKPAKAKVEEDSEDDVDDIPEIEVDEVEDDDDSDGDVIEDTSDLGDDDDVPAVVPKDGDENES